MAEDYLRRAILELSGVSPTVEGAFEKLLADEISIPQGAREQASTSKENLREFLSEQTDKDPTFPRVLRTVDSDFIGGSFGRHTKDKPLDDIDLYIPLDGHSLLYLQGGSRLPFTVISDGVLSTNPVLDFRWMDGSYVSSQKLVNGFSAALRKRYPRTSIRSDEQAVRIEMSNDLGFDVVPCFSLRPDDAGQYRFYLIPDGHGGWIRTNPRIDDAVGEQIHKANVAYRKTIRLVKHWNSSYLGGALRSYYIELAIMRAVWGKTTLRQISHGVAFGFWAVSQAVILGNLTSWLADRLPGVPSVSPGRLLEEHRRQIAFAATVSSNAWADEQAGKTEGALRRWRLLFGDSFGR